MAPKTKAQISTRTNPKAAAKASSYASKAQRENAAYTGKLSHARDLNKAGLGRPDRAWNAGVTPPSRPNTSSGPTPVQQQRMRRDAMQQRLAAARPTYSAGVERTIKDKPQLPVRNTTPPAPAAPAPAQQGGLASLVAPVQPKVAMKCGGKVKGK